MQIYNFGWLSFLCCACFPITVDVANIFQILFKGISFKNCIGEPFIGIVAKFIWCCLEGMLEEKRKKLRKKNINVVEIPQQKGNSP